MNENVYIARKKLPHKTVRVHSARYTQCIHVSSGKLKLPKDIHTNKVKGKTTPDVRLLGRRFFFLFFFFKATNILVVELLCVFWVYLKLFVKNLVHI